MYITIGRNPGNNIVVSGNDRVSGSHATIEYRDGRFLFIDDSSNGTTINGQLVHHSSRPIQQGDVIMLANSYPLTWNTILSRVPNAAPVERERPTQMRNQQQQVNVVVNQAVAPQPQYQPTPEPVHMHGSSHGGSSEISERELNKWNWGAFFLGWIWGIFNDVYWALVALIPIPLLSLIVSIVLGIKGTRQSWENGKWRDDEFEAFAKKQHGWAVAGFIVFGLGILIPILFWSAVANLLAAIL